MKSPPYISLAILASLLAHGGIALAQPGSSGLLHWEQLPDLPDSQGVAGAVVGTHGDVLVVAGGANFPEGVPWRKTTEGEYPEKVYHDRIYVLRPVATTGASSPNSLESRFEWSESTTRLPEPVAYGVSVSTPLGALYAGGETPGRSQDREASERSMVRTRKVFLLRWNSDGEEVEVSSRWRAGQRELSLPPLPVAVSAACGAIVGRHFYVAGGDSGEGGSKHFWRLDLEPPEDQVPDSSSWQWEVLPPWKGPPRTHAIAVSQRNQFLLISGRTRSGQTGLEIHTDAYRFDPQQHTREMRRAAPSGATPSDLPAYANGWTRLADVGVGIGEPRAAMAGTAVAAGYDHIYLFGGASGEVLRLHDEILPSRIAAAHEQGNEDLATELQAQREALYDDHQGFSSDVLAYCLTTDRWSAAGRMPTSGPVTTTAVRWGDRIVIPSGESRPGVRTPSVWSATLTQQKRAFGLVNWTILGGYLVSLVAIGFYFTRRESTSDDYFLAGNRVPWWAAGLSIFATMLSAITYLAIPARSYATNWTWSLLNFGIPVVTIVVVAVYLPRLLRIRGASIYQFLEQRFHISLRILGSVSFILFQLGRMGVVVLLPSLALSAATGLDVTLCIVIMGILSTLYTVLGGIEAVIWTDVVQVVVLVGGAIAALAFVSFSVDGGLAGILQSAMAHGKLNLIDNPKSHDLGWSEDGILVILIAAFFINLIPYTSDQAVIQRYLTVKDPQQVKKAIWTNAIMSIPATLLSFLVGTVLWVFYTENPLRLAPLGKADQIFPWFIAQELPVGIAGLVIAGVFAAAMSSLDSSIHSVSTVLTVDYYDRFVNSGDSGKSLRFARICTVLLGALGTLSALLLAQMEIPFLWELFQSIIGLFLGTVGGLFTLAALTRRVGTVHAWIGAVVSICLLAYVQTATTVNGLLYGAISLSTCVGVALVASLLAPSHAANPLESHEASPT